MKKKMLAQKLRIAVVILATLIGGFTALHMGQDNSFDLLNYHYYNPYALLHDRLDSDVAPAETESYLNPLPDIPNYLLITHTTPKTAGFIMGAIQGLGIWLIFEMCLLFFKKLRLSVRHKNGLALTVAILSFFGAANLSEIGGSMGDNFVGLLVLTSLLLILKSINVGADSWLGETRMRQIGYVIMGLALGLKLTNAPFAVGMLVGGLFIAPRWRAKLTQLFWNGISLFSGFILIGGWWFSRLWSMFQNPIFPYYNGIFQSSFYLPVTFTDKRWIIKSYWQAVSEPYYFTRRSLSTISAEMPFRDGRIATVFILAITLIVFYLIVKYLVKRPKLLGSWTRETKVFTTFYVVSYVIWLKQFGYYRYLITLEVLGPLAIALLIFSIIKNVKLATIGVVLVLVSLTAYVVPINWGRVDWQPTYFGVTKDNFTNLKDATILAGGYAPTGFLTPYFPESSWTIRVQSDLTSPSTGTPAMQAIIKARITQRQQRGSKFYAVRADEDVQLANESFKSFGYKVNSCSALPIYARDDNPSKFRLCTLVHIDD